MTSAWHGVLEARLRLLKVANTLNKWLFWLVRPLGPFQTATAKELKRYRGPRNRLVFGTSTFHTCRLSHSASVDIWSPQLMTGCKTNKIPF